MVDHTQCVTCEGRGGWDVPVECDLCGGTGTLIDGLEDEVICEECAGQGTWDEWERCNDCFGEGKVENHYVQRDDLAQINIEHGGEAGGA